MRNNVYMYTLCSTPETNPTIINCKLTMLQLKKQRQSMAWPDSEVRIPFAPGGFLAGLFDLPKSIFHVYIRGIDTTLPMSWENQTRQVTQYTWHRESLKQHELPSSSPNASWLAGHIKQKRKLCSPFSRQLVTQTSQAFTNNVDLFLPQLMCV